METYIIKEGEKGFKYLGNCPLVEKVQEAGGLSFDGIKTERNYQLQVFIINDTMKSFQCEDFSGEAISHINAANEYLNTAMENVHGIYPNEKH